MVVLGDDYALLSLVWCDALKLPAQKTGVLVRPGEVKGWLQKCFVTQRGRWTSVREQVAEAFGVDEDCSDPYPAMMRTHGPAFLSITRMCNPPGVELESVVTAEDDALEKGETEEHVGFRTWRVQRVSVTAPLLMEDVLRMAMEGLQEAMKHRE